MAQLSIRNAEQICTRLKGSADPCDLRKAHDIEELVLRANRVWAGQVKVLGVAAGERGTLCIPVELEGLEGLVLDGQQPRRHTQWKGLIFVPPSYPHNMPSFRFFGEIPLASHVIHTQCLPDERDLPRQLLEFVRAVRTGEEGWTCYLAACDWTARLPYNFSLVLWLVSRVVVGARFRGEEGTATLNRFAFNLFQQLAEKGKLPLGCPLAFPGDGLAADLRSEESPGHDDIEWLDQHPSGAAP